MEQYSRRDNLRQYRAQQTFHEVMDEAVNAIGLRRDDWTTQQSGDGELAILPADTPEPAVVADLVPALDRILRDHNQTLLPAARIRLRVAIHQGLVHLTGTNGFPGETVVEVSRLLDAEVLRHALRVFPHASVALIVSRSIFQDVVRQRYRGLRPERFAHVPVTVKQLATDAWIYVPDEDVNTVNWEQETPATTSTPHAADTTATPARPASPTYQISGVTTHGPTVIGPDGTAIGTVNGPWHRKAER
jgi:hypothetical protein